MKKILSCILAMLFLLLSMSSGITSAKGTDNYDKLSARLAEKVTEISSDDYIEVYLWLEDINYDEVEKEVKEKTKICYEDMKKLSDSIYLTYCKEKGITFTDLKSEKYIVNEEDWANITKDVRESVNEKVDTYISAKRKISAEKQTTKSNEILTSLKIEKENRIFESRYSPMNIVKITKDQLFEAIKSDKVIEADLCENEGVSSSCGEKTNTRTTYTAQQLMDYHKTASGAYGLSSTYAGDGIKIGMIEGNTPDDNLYVFLNSDINILSNSSYYSETSWEDKTHSSSVAAVMVGDQGLVPNASLYAISTSYASGYLTRAIGAIEDLISENVNIINHSAGTDTSNYDSIELWFEHVSTHHNVTFVQSSGNKGSYVVKPGLAYNIITVGNFNDNLTYDISDDILKSDSSYNTDVNYPNKPEVIAPGTSFPCYVENSGYTGTLCDGTSFSAPLVSGIVAYIMQANATTKTNPVLLKAILVASCDDKVLDSSGLQTEILSCLTQKQGAGTVDASKAVSIAINNKYATGVRTNVSANSYFETAAIETTNTSRKSFALSWEAPVSMGSTQHIPSPSIASSPYNFNLLVRTTTSSTILGSSTTSKSSVEVVNIASSANTFYMKTVNVNAIYTDNVRYALAWCGQ